MELLADGSLLIVFRADCGDGQHHRHPFGRFAPYMQTRSRDGGLTWSAAAPIPGTPGCAYPQLLRLASGPLLLSGGRSVYNATDDNDVWVSWDGDGSNRWERHALSGVHNAGAARTGALTYDAWRVNGTRVATLEHRQTCAYTWLLAVGGSAALVGYDLIENGTKHGYAMRIDVK